MIRLAAALALSLAAPLPALAQAEPAPEPGKVKFYVFPEHLLEGGILKPQGVRFSAGARPRHARLVRLKHAVLPKLHATRHDGALR